MEVLKKKLEYHVIQQFHFWPYSKKKVCNPKELQYFSVLWKFIHSNDLERNFLFVVVNA